MFWENNFFRFNVVPYSTANFMNTNDFIIWLKGYTDNMGSTPPTQAQWDKIRHELALVFNKITPYHPYKPIQGQVLSLLPNAQPISPVIPDQMRISC